MFPLNELLSYKELAFVVATLYNSYCPLLMPAVTSENTGKKTGRFKFRTCLYKNKFFHAMAKGLKGHNTHLALSPTIVQYQKPWPLGTSK